jgi:hypothetical protein
VNALMLMRRRCMPGINSSQLCDILVGPMVLPEACAWFRSVDNYGW